MKKYIVYFISAVLAVTCAFFIDFKIEKKQYTLDLSFSVEGDTEVGFQIFYTQSKDEFYDQKNSVERLVDIRNKQTLTFPINIKNLSSLRIDFGYKPGKVIISDVSLSGAEASKKLSLKNIATNQIDIIESTDSTLTLFSNIEDPFISFQSIDYKGTSRVLYEPWVILILSVLLFFIFNFIIDNFYAVSYVVGKIDACFLLCMFIFLLLPSLFVTSDKIGNSENRTLASKPDLIEKDGGLNTDYGNNYNSWFNDHFGFRKDLVKLYSNVIYNINGTVQNEWVLEGDDKWLFYKGDRSLLNYANFNYFNDTELNNVITYLRDINNWCEQNGKKFYCVICPDKNKIYGDKIRYVYKANSDSLSRVQHLINVMNATGSGVKIKYLYDALKSHVSQDSLLYYKTDTHWTLQGSYYGYQELMKLISADFPNIKPCESTLFLPYNHYRGDLSRMCTFPFDDDSTNYYYPVFPSVVVPDLPEITYSNPQGTGRVAMFGDSFSMGWWLYMGNTFSYVKLKKTNYLITAQDLEIIKNDADIVVLELVERLAYLMGNLHFPIQE